MARKRDMGLAHHCTSISCSFSSTANPGKCDWAENTKDSTDRFMNAFHGRTLIDNLSGEYTRLLLVTRDTREKPILFIQCQGLPVQELQKSNPEYTASHHIMLTRMRCIP
ncbi:hypothetical protein H112_08946 [Trichophyton rubrum D6]|uniref:Uncharacterized protein n=2 Tax=Trichophyton TaxID=5550 RepID=A0A022VMN5_TRIRU|nr:hypothetical protein H100_08969 [Trichophyton rubrum MR850]EZF36583.1 hypothetical protein H102_08927 [Trichophyton rubrum CBS 100081]EZF47164.1 hypothetical protein H103_08950 [Trichophyton rubrum CBS 288.86]EZF57846.1 hypothetical protein H104_08898 [Trichophyton rubrum CBS 289.86]EZF68434.1 hypothetical protein H105_08955 [Trichophyton soudanense CBS 452.61]EZF79136.1 hypothetical protein H110_08950 [Trichophyton rubrum MR1448]EZF89753.1 hypothetical protein H113_09015 [Trichophyton rub